MKENKINDEPETKKCGTIHRGSLLDDQFKETLSNKFLLYNDENQDKEKTKKEKPTINRSLIGSFSKDKYKNFLSKIEKSNENIKNMDKESVRIDKDMFDQSHDNIDENCVVMDVSMGIFDVCNENLNDNELREKNITISEVPSQEHNEQCKQELIEEL
ncbi:conserved Plasmodium protein, unknown function [Plasmodium berghei]|uniref:Uncharacterized protein n=2 Tax=Plasmodium berghei TaxID=5821 RepID=A0A509ANF6_PLABA|nr:conserved Plasmodium protein, unknown function [Plasmodium berghei ANKA]CXI53826.1 conserved Plasmodium protein, unknown function [Plasmodium berghei]SCL94862.1 conserved Plasmodium protein, unknown function [Plasmodium berghei]SCM16120.1 conserved Plasmodium protein, unknown function [Plasmodium berghei]SCM17916.1 conserved Plasmodium protein, unknown function [Plasmodium berghei]SCN26261.1 conserved Plasmodium protein, unknown function [Plasmodium berghei]|eukprot:XP_034422044.1 conserved Plasmodium protein, unknown function [Plasmodium berghei ANKA]